VRVLLGLVLLTAAVLKLSGLNVTAVPRAGWFAKPQVQGIAAEWKLVLGLWLLSGAYQPGAWLAAVGTFLAFAGVSGYFGWTGVANCGYFGVIRTSPWTAFGVDMAALALLVIFRPDFRTGFVSILFQDGRHPRRCRGHIDHPDRRRLVDLRFAAGGTGTSSRRVADRFPRLR
jgi:hypothetical protein